LSRGPTIAILAVALYVLLLPEVAFNEERFLAKVEEALGRYGHCVVAVSEGVKRPDGKFLSASSREDAFGHAQLGGVAPVITNLITARLGCKGHWAVPDYLQRSARHIASKTDVEQAYAVGRAAVEFAVAGRNAVMPAIRRLSDAPYRWDIVEAPLSEVANQEKLLPTEFISADGFGITEAARRYLGPLIVGEAYPRLAANRLEKVPPLRLAALGFGQDDEMIRTRISPP